MDTQNQYGAYVIFTEESTTKQELVNQLKEALKLDSDETFHDKIVLLRKCIDISQEDTKRWHLCVKKEYIEQLREYGKDNGLKFYSYKANNKPIGPGKTYAFYIPYKSESTKQSILSVISKLDGTFIRPGSYHVHHPSPREDGSDRGYFLLSFEKNGDYYPRPFIRTLRALLNDLPISEDELMDVKWCSHRVLRDVTEGNTK